MKRFLITIAVVLLLAAGCSQQANLSAWLLGGDGLTARVGYDTNSVEIGGEGMWIKDSAGDLGIYGLYKFPGIVQIPNPIPVSGLPEQLSGTAYIGYHGGIDIIDNGTYSGPIAGFNLNGFIIEYQNLNADYKLKDAQENKLVLGFCWQFK